MSANPLRGIAAARFGINDAIVKMAIAAVPVRSKRYMLSSLVGAI
jgi:hypothetical protein